MLHLPSPPRLRLIGEAACICADGRVLTLEPKDALLLAYLAIVGPTPRRALAVLLWPDVDEERARANLRQRLFRLRKALGFELLEGAAVAHLAAAVQTDLADPDPGAGELVAGVTESEAGSLSAWLEASREHRRVRRIESLAGLASAHENTGQLALAIATAQQLVEADATSEHAHRRLMRLHYLRGDRAAALAAFDRCSDVLQRVLGIAPEPETEALRRHVEALLPPPETARSRALPLPVSVLRPPRLIGREPELATLAQAWQTGQSCAVVGEAGLGKTRLLEALVQSQPDAVRSAGRPGDGAVAFTTLARLLRAVVQRFDGTTVDALLPQVRHEIARLLPEWAPARPREREGQRFVLQSAVRSLLASAPGLRVVVIDDLHFADPATLDVLQALIDPGDAAQAPLAWLLAYRPAEAGTHLHSFHDAWLDLALPLRVTLQPLVHGEVARLVDSLELAALRGAEVAGHLLRRTGGNPLFILELLKQAWAEGSLHALVRGDSLLRPPTVQQLIERRLSQLSPAALMLARVAAVAAPDFRIELAEEVLGQPAMQLASAWGELEAAQVLRDGSFAHDLVYEATLGSVPRAIARRTHAAVARWLAAHDGEPARVAAHFIAAADDVAAIAPLREAARRSQAQTFVAQARGFLEHAAALCLAAGRDAEEFAVRFELHQNYIVDDPGSAHEALVQRLATLANTETERLDAAWALHNLRRFRQTTSPLADIEADVASAERLGDERVLAAMVTMLVSGYLASGQPDAAEAALARHAALFERSAKRSELADFIGNLADLLGEQDRFDESLPHLDRACALYREAGEPAEVMVMMCNRTRHLRQQGRMVAAQEVFEQIDRWHAANAPNPRTWMVTRAGGSEVLRELGRYRDSLQVLNQPREEVRSHMGRLVAAFALAQAKLWLALGQSARAGQAIAEMDRDLADAPDWLQARCGLAAAQVGARIRGGGECDRPTKAEWLLLDRASALAPRQLRRSAWFECELQRAAWLEPSAGAALADSIDLVAMDHGMVGYAQQAKLCAAAQRLACGQAGAALQRARAAQADQQHRFGEAQSAEPVHPSGGSVAERDLILARVLLACDQPDAPALIAAARQRLGFALQAHVPAQFQAGFRDRNPVHRALLALSSGMPDV
ncbi:MAG: AAA family ATPase [Pseudomonadota bacterium]